MNNPIQCKVSILSIILASSRDLIENISKVEHVHKQGNHNAQYASIFSNTSQTISVLFYGLKFLHSYQNLLGKYNHGFIIIISTYLCYILSSDW